MADTGAVLIIRTRDRVRKLRNEVRRADRALAELERSSADDVLGRYVVPAGHELDLAELTDFIQLARLQDPGGELHIIVIAREGLDQGEAP